MTPASARRLRGAADRRAAERRGTPPAHPARGARARRRRRKPGMTQPSCVSDGESHLRTPHVSSFGAEACAAAASARPTSSPIPPSRAYYRTRLEPTLAVARARRACVLRVRPGRARRACECGSRSFGRPTARAARAGGGRPSASHGRGTAPCPWPLAQLPTHPPRDPPSGLARALLSARPPPSLDPRCAPWPMRRRGPWHAFRCAPRPRHRRARASLPSHGGGTMTRSAKHPVIPV